MRWRRCDDVRHIETDRQKKKEEEEDEEEEEEYEYEQEHNVHRTPSYNGCE